MKKTILFMAAIWAAATFLGGCRKNSADSSRQIQRPLPVVSIVEMATQSVTITRELPGRTVPFLVAEVRPRVSGIVEERLFEEGTVVQAGQPLYRLDDALYRAEFNRLQAAVEAARTTVALSVINADRTTRLFESNAVSQQEFDNAASALLQAKAQLAISEAALASAKVTLDYCLITSPFSGRIGKSSVTKGALVTANQPDALAVVQQLDKIYVDISRSSLELLQLRRMMAEENMHDSKLPVSILLEDGSTFESQGTIAFTDVTIDPTTGSFTLRIEVPNPDGILLPGMYVRTVLSEAMTETGILVPQQAVQRDPTGRTSVMIVRDDNTVEQRAIVVGQSIGNKWLVNSGLLAGDRVIIEGLQKIRAGMPVRIEPVSSSPTEG